MSFNFLNRKWGRDDLGYGSGEVTWSMSLENLNYNSVLYPDVTEAEFASAIRASFDAWEAIANVDFTEIPNPNGAIDADDVDIFVDFTRLSGNTVGLATTSFRDGTDDRDGIDVILDVEIEFDTRTSWLPYGGAGTTSLFAVSVHEIGHAIGLGHVDDPSEILNPFVSANDLGEGDIEGAQRIYGAKQFGDSGNNVLAGYSGNDFLYGGRGNDQLIGDAGADQLFGGAGVDRVVYSGARTGVTADLILNGRNTGDAAGDTYSDVELLFGSNYADDLRGTQTNNVVVGDGGDDRLFGRGGDDDIYGGNGNDQLDGGAGADDLIGGAGVDRALYNTASAGVTADLILNERNTGDAAGDTYNSIELIFGSRYADELRGTQTNNLLVGNAGDDLLYGRGGDDDIFGGAGDDLLHAGDGNDELFGGAGADWFIGGNGADRVTYSGAVTADLILSERNTGEAAGDTYSSIELLYGSRFSDELRGTQTNNVVVGYDGNDLLYARGGNDNVFGGSGNDLLDGAEGNDNLYGGPGTDRFVFRANMGRDTIHDFENDQDTLVLDDALWGGNLTVTQVVSSFGSVANGNAVLDFGGGNVVTLIGVASVGILPNDIDIV